MIPPARLIESPPRSNTAGVVIILVTALLLSIVPLSLRTNPWAVLISVLLAMAALLFRQIQAFHVSFFSAVLVVLQFLIPALHNWPFNLFIPLCLYCAAVLMVPALRKSFLWLRPGRFDGDIAVMVVVTAVISGCALNLWYVAFHPDLSLHLGYLPDMPLWLYPFAGLGFSIGNAAMEEFVFRGVIMQALDSIMGPRPVSIIVQAWLFGVMHYLRGFPYGGWGLAMAFVYGVLLGAIRRRCRGMLAPWVAHVCADLVIFTILAGIVLWNRR